MRHTFVKAGLNMEAYFTLIEMLCLTPSIYSLCRSTRLNINPYHLIAYFEVYLGVIGDAHGHSLLCNSYNDIAVVVNSKVT